MSSEQALQTALARLGSVFGKDYTTDATLEKSFRHPSADTVSGDLAALRADHERRISGLEAQLNRRRQAPTPTGVPAQITKARLSTGLQRLAIAGALPSDTAAAFMRRLDARDDGVSFVWSSLSVEQRSQIEATA